MDDRRRWYPYHQLFADVLRTYLLDEQLDIVPQLHRRASIWYEQNDELDEAIDHALAAQDFQRAAGLIELAIPVLRRDRREATLRPWLTMLPDELVCTRPVLHTGFVGALMARGELEGVEDRLRNVERWLRRGPLAVPDRGPPPARWSFSTWRNFPASRPPLRCIVPHWLWPRVMGPAQ